MKKFDKSFALSGEKRTRKAYGASDPNRTLEDALKRRSDPWNILQVALTAERDSILRRLAEPRDLGLEGMARLRGELMKLDWVLKLPEEIIGRAGNL